MSPFTYLKRRINMKDIDEMFKDILEDKDEDYTFSNFTLPILLMLIAMSFKDKIDNDQPIINIYLGDE